jgi:hypothetical protein
MITSRLDGRLMIVLQVDHARQAEIFARAWGNAAVAPLANHRRASILAARHHDDGWAVWERHPTLDPRRGQPLQFVDVRPAEHLPALRAGVERAAQLDPWTGLLVSMHCAGLYNDRFGTYPLEELDQRFTAGEQSLIATFQRDMHELQTRLLAEHPEQPPTAAPADAPDVRHAYLAMQVWDRLSLQFALRHATDAVIRHAPLGPGVTGELTARNAGPFRLELDPYPFAVEPLRAPLRIYELPDRRYESAAELVDCLQAVAPRTLACEVVAAGTLGP